MTRFILDSADLNEYTKLSRLAKDNKSNLWGATTNPTLIAKALKGKKVTRQDAFNLQKEIIMQILDIVEGSVSAEVYADKNTTADEMIKQGREIAQWSKRIHIKLPTTLEGFKARTALRINGIPTNNTLVFSQEQIFAVCLHEKLIQETYDPPDSLWPPFVSPFVGRLDDQSQDGMMLVENGMKIKECFDYSIWMLEASVRQAQHIKRGIIAQTELITVPAKIYEEWLLMSQSDKDRLDSMKYSTNLLPISYWNAPNYLSAINSIADFETAIRFNKLNIQHPLTQTGLEKFANDWQDILIA